MKWLGTVMTVVGGLGLLGIVVRIANPHAPPHPWTATVGGIGISLLLVGGGVALYRSRPTSPPAAVTPGAPLSWIDRQFLTTSWPLLIALCLLVNLPMWVASGIGALFGDHPLARRRARILFGGLTAYLLIAVGVIYALATHDRPATVAVAPVASAPDLARPVADGWIRYTGRGVWLQGPNGWTPAQGLADNKLLRLTAVGGAVMAVSNIASEPGATLETIARNAPSIGTAFPDGFTLSHSGIVKFNGTPAARADYDATLKSGSTFRFSQFVWLIQDKTYLLTFTAPPQRFDELVATVEQMAATLHFGNVTPERTIVAAKPTLIPTPGPTQVPAAVAPPPADAVTPPITPPRPPPVAIVPPVPSRMDSPLASPPRSRLSTTRPRSQTASFFRDAPLVVPPPDKAAEQFKRIASAWQPAAAPPVDLLPTLDRGTRDADGVTLHRFDRVTTAGHFKPPVTFRIVALTQNNDTRLAYAADQIIFNWEMRPTELRVDGGPANGRHSPGAGQLPAGEWTGIELTVTPTELVLRVNGRETYRTAADFSHVDAPLRITAHRGSVKLHALEMVTP